MTGLTMVQRMFKIEKLKQQLQLISDLEDTPSGLKPEDEQKELASRKKIITKELNKLIDDQLDRSFSVGKIYII
jgi:hypothetical protein